MGPPTRVMVVDDAALMRSVIGDLVRQSGCEVVASCANGREALLQLRALAPDVVLLDLEMPVMDRLTFLRHARLLTRARIVVLSSVVEVGSPRAREARRLGADVVIAKPSGAVSLDLAATTGALLSDTLRRAAP
ncbi:MAG: response regulator [Deltaproteobacteria bacterium]|nr:response regulator [Deltaproteobacteria bacterium]